MKCNINNLKMLCDGFMERKEVPDVTGISEKMGVKVSVVEMNCDINGGYKKSLGKYNIFIKEGLSFEFSRFLTAYLLSYICFYGDKCKSNVVYNGSLYDRLSYSKALDILMPDKFFQKDILDMLNKKQIEKLLDIWCISEGLLYEKMKLNEEKEKFKVVKTNDMKNR